MSLSRLTKIHDIDIFDQTVKTGAGFTVRRVFDLTGKPSRTDKCRMVPKSVIEQQDLLKQHGIEADHEMHFSHDPKLGLNSNVRWNGLLLRVTRPPLNQHGLRRELGDASVAGYWIGYAKMVTPDNPSAIEAS